MGRFFTLHNVAIVGHVSRSQASRTVMDSNKSTALFEIPQLTAQQGGLWECRVSTSGGHDSRKFNLTIKGLQIFLLLFCFGKNKIILKLKIYIYINFFVTRAAKLCLE